MLYWLCLDGWMDGWMDGWTAHFFHRYRWCVVSGAGERLNGDTVAAAYEVGKLLGKKSLEKGIWKVWFDRGQYRYVRLTGGDRRCDTPQGVSRLMGCLFVVLHCVVLCCV